MILDGKMVANNLLEKIKNEIQESPLTTPPTLAVVLVGNNPASLSYIKMKQKRAEEIGMNFILKKLDENISEEMLKNEVKNLANDTKIHGIIVQAPLPKHLNMDTILECIPENKDIDGFTKSQIGNMFLGNDGLYSCTPKGILTLFEAYKIDLKGKNIAIIGRSNIVGKPMSLLCINAGATVISCNSHTKNLENITKNADIIIVAVGKPHFLTKNMVSENSIIIDVGSNFENGKFCGDADFENLVDFVRAISPSPGGVGPLTVATLLENTWKAYQKNI